MAHLFCEVVQETCRAIVHVLLKTYIRFPTGEELKRVVNGFQDKWGFPQCVGAIDGSHVPIAAPELNHSYYYNRKGWLIQAIVDHNYMFRDICVGWAGSVHDARVFANSLIYKRITEDGLLTDVDCRTLAGKEVPVCIIGDSAYPINTWLMKPFAETSALSPQQKHYNYRLSPARIVVENAFGCLKARWRRLLKRNDMHTEHIPTVVSACCVLHNVCEAHGESFNDAWLIEESEYEQPTPPSIASTSSSRNSEDIRNAFVQYLYAQS